MDISYIKENYNCGINTCSGNLTYFDKHSNSFYDIHNLSKEHYQNIKNKVENLDDQIYKSSITYKIVNYFDNINSNKKAFAPVWHYVTRMKVNGNTEKRIRIITDNAQIIMDTNMNNIIDISSPKNKISYSKFKKIKKNK